MIFATCAALAVLLADPSGGKRIALTEDCHAAADQPAVVFRHQYRLPVIIEAGPHKVQGVQIMKAGNISWRGGQVEAPCQAADCKPGPPQYGFRIVDASNVMIEGVHLTAARKAIVLDRAISVTLRHSRCNGAVEDCLIANASQQIEVTHNEFGPFQFRPTQCTIGSSVTPGLSKRDCIARGGTWKDGDHPDLAQLRGGTKRVLIAFNRAVTTGQGFTQMDTTGDAPLAMVQILANDLRAGRHGLTLGACTECLISRNSLVTAVAGWRAVIIPGQARACANRVPSGGPGRDPCSTSPQ